MKVILTFDIPEEIIQQTLAKEGLTRDQFTKLVETEFCCDASDLMEGTKASIQVVDI